MKFIRTDIHDVVICEPSIHGDERGYFCETFRQDKLDMFLGFKLNFCQDNESKSNKGVLRGLHYQLPPFAQSKLVRVISGKVLDVAVDIRQHSPTFGQHICVELSESNKRQLFVPRGFAHGFLVLEDNTLFSYKVDNFYSKQSDRGIRFNDSFLNINWGLPFEDLKLSEKDCNAPLLNDVNDLFEFEKDYYG
tara:strand:+ start:128 stop:703 length:576 start_codon:yes stop_codon:yes gene_type:complete